MQKYKIYEKDTNTYLIMPSETGLAVSWICQIIEHMIESSNKRCVNVYTYNKHIEIHLRDTLDFHADILFLAWYYKNHLCKISEWFYDF